MIPIPPSPIVGQGGNITQPWFLFLLGIPQSFTPEISFGNSSAGVTYSLQLGSATVGAGRVFFDVNLVLTNKGAQVGTARIKGLPQVVKTVSNYKPSFTLGFVSSVSVDAQLMSTGSPGEPNVYLYRVSAGTPTLLTDADFANDSVVVVSGSYQVDQK